ncbi:5-oxoprolinase subunit PxpA [Alkalihalobacterium alkalinitrilicum]|uniref:5-oxoprolinase subunit PxpA n=1 Tax=Alkalihalobacterium alkalinitrilicum TaxID=427920 RepID=UPI0009952773|nr:5-oxoprolinase subunit PxpA [Alkalihalobacterium alkalinitrilicum]
MKSVDLNCDLGESFGSFVVGQDELVLAQITSANIACGYHAGDHNVMAKTVKMAKEKGVSIGAHPGFPDLIGFGRRVIQTEPSDIYHFVIYQIGALQGFCKVNDVEIRHVKPHGALYNTAAKDPKVAEAIAQAVYEIDPSLVLFGLSGSELIKAGLNVGLTVANEVFADRTYQPDGTLTPRTHQNALIHETDTAIQQVLMMVKEGTVKTVDGSYAPIQADTICIHGDGPSALDFARSLRETLVAEGVNICPAEGSHYHKGE